MLKNLNHRFTRMDTDYLMMSKNGFIFLYLNSSVQICGLNFLYL